MTELKIDPAHAQKTIYENPPTLEAAPEFPLQLQFESGEVIDIVESFTCFVKSPTAQAPVQLSFDGSQSIHIQIFRLLYISQMLA